MKEVFKVSVLFILTLISAIYNFTVTCSFGDSCTYIVYILLPLITLLLAGATLLLINKSSKESELLRIIKIPVVIIVGICLLNALPSFILICVTLFSLPSF
jgi:hypothetical protein